MAEGSSVDSADVSLSLDQGSPANVGLNVTSEILAEDAELSWNSALEDSIDQRAARALNIESVRELLRPNHNNTLASGAESLIGVMFSALTGDMRSAACSVSPSPSRCSSRQSMQRNTSMTSLGSQNTASPARRNPTSAPKQHDPGLLVKLEASKDSKSPCRLDKIEQLYQMELLPDANEDSIMSEPELQAVFGAQRNPNTMELLSAAGKLQERREAHGGYGTPSSYASEREMTMYFDNQPPESRDFSPDVDATPTKELQSGDSTDTGVDSELSENVEYVDNDHQIFYSTPQPSIVCCQATAESHNMLMLSQAASKCERSVAHLELFASIAASAPNLHHRTQNHNDAPSPCRRRNSFDSPLKCSKQQHHLSKPLGSTGRLQRMLRTASTNMIDEDISKAVLLNLTTPNRSMESRRPQDDDCLGRFTAFQDCLHELLADETSPLRRKGRDNLNRSRSFDDSFDIKFESMVTDSWKSCPSLHKGDENSSSHQPTDDLLNKESASLRTDDNLCHRQFPETNELPSSNSELTEDEELCMSDGDEAEDKCPIKEDDNLSIVPHIHETTKVNQQQTQKHESSAFDEPISNRSVSNNQNSPELVENHASLTLPKDESPLTAEPPIFFAEATFEADQTESETESGYSTITCLEPRPSRIVFSSHAAPKSSFKERDAEVERCETGGFEYLANDGIHAKDSESGLDCVDVTTLSVKDCFDPPLQHYTDVSNVTSEVDDVMELHCNPALETSECEGKIITAQPFDNVEASCESGDEDHCLVPLTLKLAVGTEYEPRTNSIPDSEVAAHRSARFELGNNHAAQHIKNAERPPCKPVEQSSSSKVISAARHEETMRLFNTPTGPDQPRAPLPTAPKKNPRLPRFENRYKDLDRKIEGILNPAPRQAPTSGLTLSKGKATERDPVCGASIGSGLNVEANSGGPCSRRKIFSENRSTELKDTAPQRDHIKSSVDQMVDDTAVRMGEKFLLSAPVEHLQSSKRHHEDDAIKSVTMALQSIKLNLERERENAEKLQENVAKSRQRIDELDESSTTDDIQMASLSEAGKQGGSKVRTLEEVVILLKKHVQQRELEIDVLGKQLNESNSRIKKLEKKLNDKSLDEYRMKGLQQDKDDLYKRLNGLLSDREKLETKIVKITRQKEDAEVATQKAKEDLQLEVDRRHVLSKTANQFPENDRRHVHELKERVDELEVLNKSSAGELERAERELNSLKRENRSLRMSNEHELVELKADHTIMREKLDRMHEISAENLLLHTDVADYQKELSELREEARLLRSKSYELSEENRQCKAEIRDLRRYMDLMRANKSGDTRQDLLNKIEYYQMEHDRLLDEVRHLKQRLGDVSPRSPRMRSSSPTASSRHTQHSSPSKQSVRFSESLERGRSPVTDAMAASTASSYAATRVRKDRSLSPSAALNVRDLTMDRYSRHMEGPESRQYDCIDGRESPHSDDSECTEMLLKPQPQVNGCSAAPPGGMDSDDDDVELHISSLRNGKGSSSSSSAHIGVRSGSSDRLGSSPHRRSRSPGSPVGFRCVSPRLTSSQKCVNDTARDRYPTQMKRSLPRRAFAPRNPSDIRLGYCIKFTRPGGKLSRGTVRYIGHLPTRNEIFVGVELDGHDGKHSGTYQGTKYFTCPPNKGVFTPFNKVIMAWE